MAVRTMISNSDSKLVITETSADYLKSGSIAGRSNGSLLEVGALPRLFEDREFLRAVESTEYYKRYGTLSFWTGSLGISLEDGDYRINCLGKSLEDKYVRAINDQTLFAIPIPFNRRAHVCKGSMPVLATVFQARSVGRIPPFWLKLDGSAEIHMDAQMPVVIFEQQHKDRVAQRLQAGDYYHGLDMVIELPEAARNALRRKV